MAGLEADGVDQGGFGGGVEAVGVEVGAGGAGGDEGLELGSDYFDVLVAWSGVLPDLLLISFMILRQQVHLLHDLLLLKVANLSNYHRQLFQILLSIACILIENSNTDVLRRFFTRRVDRFFHFFKRL